jgi:hypothetical protein
MNGLNESTVISFFVVGLLAVLNKQVVVVWQIAAAAIKGLVFGREYNLDGDTKTPDWFDGFNSGDGTWGLTQAVSYHLLFVKTVMRDAGGGLHQRDISILEWIATKFTRRHVSKEQKEAITAAGNNWPPMPTKHQDHKAVMVLAMDRLQGEVGRLTNAFDRARQSREEDSLKRPALDELWQVALGELATSNRDVARSLDSAGTKVGNAGKKVAKAWCD